jgi:hypothetical protein
MNECEVKLEVGEAAETGMSTEIFVLCANNGNGSRPASQSKSGGWYSNDHQQLIILLIFLGLIHGCGQGGPEVVADGFMNSYYSAANLGEALKLADGLAAKKIQDQQRLVKVESGAQTTPGRRVSYSLLEKTETEGKLFFRYEVRIEVQGSGSFTRKALLALNKEPNGWRVTNFSDSE